MKPDIYIVLAWTAVTTVSLRGQGYLIYDQVSPVPGSPPGAAEWRIPDPNLGSGQSFTPSLSRIDFIDLRTGDYTASNGRGGGVFVILRSDSISGPIIASTAPVLMEDGFGHGPGVENTVSFFFQAPVPLTPGTTYYFQPVVEMNSDPWYVIGYNSYRYSGGTAFWQGEAQPGLDMWFRTGIVIPEPSSLALGLFGLAALAAAKRACADRRQAVGAVFPTPPESPTPTLRRGA
ncbi:PEP-CTERM sorting domain-containing protein [Nitrospira sp. BLG_2]|uniref:PEP-CTERM sorting domain-containing protein n=1 Tax=Nitrospira sp. BLG_2 TaxID=3397507 RepID=UPI003B9A080A